MREYDEIITDSTVVSRDEKLFGMLIYLSSFVTTFIGPLIIWLLKKDESDFVDFHGKQYMNFLITYFIYSAISIILMLVIIGFILIWMVGIAILIFTIIGCIKAFSGERWRMPFIIRFLK